MVFRLFVIVSCCENFGIGYNGTIPWKPLLPKNQEYFTNLTIGNPGENQLNAVIMGRKTFLSFPRRERPLEARVNIALSSDVCKFAKKARTNVYMCDGIPSLIDLLNTTLSRFIDIAWVIGGESMFKWALEQPYCERIYMTWIKKKYECDAFFPPIPDKFEIITDDSLPQGEQQEGDIKYEYRVYENVLLRDPVYRKLHVNFVTEPSFGCPPWLLIITTPNEQEAFYDSEHPRTTTEPYYIESETETTTVFGFYSL